jgi:hypothetical protein
MNMPENPEGAMISLLIKAPTSTTASARETTNGAPKMGSNPIQVPTSLLVLGVMGGLVAWVGHRRM